MPSARERFLRLYRSQSEFVTRVVGRVIPADQMDAVRADAAREFEAMVDDIPYGDRPEHPMAMPILACYGFLSFFKALRSRGHSAHEFGRAILAEPNPQSFGEDADVPRPEGGMAALQAAALESQRSGAADEFVFELVEGDGAETDWGMNITSCAICHAFAKHDAMELVPYLCATDDSMSKLENQGLRRTGTIALGAHHCDFRYKAGGEPLTLASQYKDQIRLTDLES